MMKAAPGAIVVALMLAGCAAMPPRPVSGLCPLGGGHPPCPVLPSAQFLRHRSELLAKLPVDANLSPTLAHRQRALMARGLYLDRRGGVRKLPASDASVTQPPRASPPRGFAPTPVALASSTRWPAGAKRVPTVRGEQRSLMAGGPYLDRHNHVRAGEKVSQGRVPPRPQRLEQQTADKARGHRRTFVHNAHRPTANTPLVLFVPDPGT